MRKRRFIFLSCAILRNERKREEHSSDRRTQNCDFYQNHDHCNLYGYLLIFLFLFFSIVCATIEEHAQTLFLYISVIAIRDLPAVTSWQRPSEEIFHVGYHDVALCNHDLALYAGGGRRLCVLRLPIISRKP